MTKHFLILLAALFMSAFLFGQDCTLSVTGKVIDKGTGRPLSFSNIYVQESKQGTISKEDGSFSLENMCPGHYHITISHLGCSPGLLHLDLYSDTIVTIELNHHDELLDEITIKGEGSGKRSAAISTVSRSEISRESQSGLSTILETISGVSSLKSGTDIAKPIVHGLYGNRVEIMNHGIPQAGQQWGNDHAPEIDPFVAQKISVVKGAASLEYGGSSLGSIVLIEPGNITGDKHLEGIVNYVFQSNGLGNTLNTRFERSSKLFSYRLTSSFKVKGDSKAADYYLTNTAKNEISTALQMQKKAGISESEIYYSFYFNNLGILRGSHIGNLTDLEEALVRDEPFYTEDKISFDIAAPRQKVAHHLFKANSDLRLSEKIRLKGTYAFQLNDRREYDVRRNGRSDRPTLHMLQLDHFAEVSLRSSLDKWSLRSGIQLNYVNNKNVAGTGTMPLIPQYNQIKPAAFFIASTTADKWFFESGVRYAFNHLEVATITTSFPLEVLRFKHNFHDYALSSSVSYMWSRGNNFGIQAGYMSRSPEVNELYSSGLHQGVSGIEEGNRNLDSERSLKLQMEYEFNWKDKLFGQFVSYYQNINDYIYLEPQDSFRLTIRGAFPLFIYKQDDVMIYGSDFLLSYEPIDKLKLSLKYAIVRGELVEENVVLINLPSDNLTFSMKYSVKLKDRTKASFGLDFDYVWQNRIEPEQDFIPPPDAYYLIGAMAGVNLPLGKSYATIELIADNLLNRRYRDYLNRQKYFADEVGRDVRLRLAYLF
ncbi:MAG: TonB-dependent receptor [Chitinophagales bacterium]|nr:TonB-dependent receptor [Chitinophagales bacterium]